MCPQLWSSLEQSQPEVNFCRKDQFSHIYYDNKLIRIWFLMWYHDFINDFCIKILKEFSDSFHKNDCLIICLNLSAALLNAIQLGGHGIWKLERRKEKKDIKLNKTFILDSLISHEMEPKKEEGLGTFANGSLCPKLFVLGDWFTIRHANEGHFWSLPIKRL